MIPEDVKEPVLTHGDCRNYVSMDVAKGICRRTSDVVPINAASCDAYEQLPKCKFCSRFAEGVEGDGACTAEQGEPWAYAEMIAVTCEMFRGN